MRYIPNTDADCREMLRIVGVDSVEELFGSIPAEVRFKGRLDLPEPMDEAALLRHLRELSERNKDAERYSIFLGAGAYNHFIPSAVNHIVSRSEFYTSYTPYQPEVSQGTLQAIFEYQTLICQLTGMEVSNASMYDGASALAEAVLMALRINGRRKVIASSAIHPHYREVVKTYISNLGVEYEEVGFDDSGLTESAGIGERGGEDVSCVLVQSPNFFGGVEPLAVLGEAIRAAGALFIVSVVEPISLGILRPPGDFGADVVVGEGQPLGNPLNFGGPYLGLFASKKEFVRHMPGRLVGETVDKNGKRGYVLTLSTREQHIRREKATSNICTNEGLCALTAAAYLSLLGKSGIRQLAIQNLQRAALAKRLISNADGVRVRFGGPTFNEFVVETEGDPGAINERLAENGIIGGLPLEPYYPELGRSILLCVTENNGVKDIEKLARLLGK